MLNIGDRNKPDLRFDCQCHYDRKLRSWCAICLKCDLHCTCDHPVHYREYATAWAAMAEMQSVREIPQWNKYRKNQEDQEDSDYEY